MKNVIVSQNRHWEEEFKNLYKREVLDSLIDKLHLKQIQVLQGIRRSGKSTTFKLIINHLMQKVDPLEILYINLDDPIFIPFSNDATKFYDIIQTAKQITKKDIKYLFLDEVQNISGWERFVKSIYDNEEFIKIFITGSNSSLLSGKLATLLSGRYIVEYIAPLSLKEIFDINGITSQISLIKQTPKVLNLIDDALKYGSFVEVYEEKSGFKREILSSYYESIILKDCVSNNNIRDVKSFKELSFYLLKNSTSLYSYNSLAKAINIHDKSVKEYIGYLEDSYLFSEIKQYSYSLKEQNNSKKKLYCADNGFLLLGEFFSNDHGKLLENLVFNELKKNGYKVYFYHKNFECDFIAKKDNKLIALQVCYELDERNIKREVNGLLKLPFKVDEKYIITYNQSKTSGDIKVLPIFEFGFHQKR